MAYDNCTSLRQDFPAGVKKGHPAYAIKHDRDRDGYACEVSGRESEAATASPSPSPSTSARTEASVGTNNRLPQTGPGEITAVGALVMAIGAVVVLTVRRKRTRFISG